VSAAADRLKVALTRSPRAYALARRPYALARFLARRPHDPDYAAFALFAPTDKPFLDVGANAGMSALSYRIFQRRGPVVSIEPNRFHEPDLVFAGRIVRRFEHRIWAAGAQEATLTLFVPVYRGVPLTTEAALDLADVAASPTLRRRLGARMDSAEFTIQRQEVQVRPLDALALDPAFVKLDVQGHEHPALLGLRATIERSRPVLMIESAGEDSHRMLLEMGYQARAYDRASGRLGPARWPVANVFYVTS
jgi:FkbM family methyltransferase